MKLFPLASSGLVLATTLIAASFGCSSTAAAPDGSTPVVTDDASTDAGLDTAPSTLPTIAEKEPNDGKTAAEIQNITVPAIVTGAIDPVSDVDGFRAKLTGGDLFVWKLEATGADFTPYIGVVEKDDSVPHFVARGEMGKSIELEQFVTKSSDWQIAITDSRNATGRTPVGGATFGYKLTAQKVTRVPTPIAVGNTATSVLTSPYAVGLFDLSLSSATALDINVRAKRLSTPSDIDSRLSIVNQADGTWVSTNDDMSSGQTDSKLGADALPAGKYVLVVENVNPTAKTFGFEVVVTKR